MKSVNSIEHILLADDDKDHAMLFERMVRQDYPSIKVSNVNDGDQLLFFLHLNKVDLLFLDLNMPVKNGFEVLKELRQLKQFNKVPVVIFTTSDHEAAIETTRRLGANLYVTKPLTYNLLKGVIRHVLSIDWANFTPSDGNFVYRGN